MGTGRIKVVMMSVLRLRKIACLVSLLVIVSYCAAQGRSEEPIKVRLCQLKNDPGAYDHKLVQITAFASRGFEYFSLFEPGCSSENGVWLEYGGVVGSGTIYCCEIPAERKRKKQLVVENISIPLVDNSVFREFDKIRRFENSSAHATIIGRFFSDAKMKDGNSFGGYGHMGCCSLLAIQQVLSVDPQDRDDLYYGGPTEQRNVDVGCQYGSLQDLSYDEVFEAQHRAELGQREWSFDDPQRVATETLARLLKLDEKSIIGIKKTSASQGRVVYHWRPQTKLVTYMIVVRRPYWLAYYATGTKRVGWIVTDVYESSCK